jgi:hypothetical protein
MRLANTTSLRSSWDLGTQSGHSVGHELIAAGMLILAASGRGKALD